MTEQVPKIAIYLDFENLAISAKEVYPSTPRPLRIDDILDYAYSTVMEMEILKVKPTPYTQRMVSLLRDAAAELLQAVDRLESHPGVAGEHAQRAKALENRVEEVYREALADLFSGTEDIKQVVKMLKFREVYRHLSNAADRGDEAANVIADIVVKIG